jgi:aminopeptidase
MTLLASLRDWLKAQQLDAVLLSSRQNKQPHLGISTGSGYVVISRVSAHILVDSRYYADVEARTQGYQLHLLDATNTLTTIVNQIIADEQLQTLGFEGQQVSWETAHRWQSMRNWLAPRRMCCGKSKRQRRWRKSASPVGLPIVVRSIFAALFRRG